MSVRTARIAIVALGCAWISVAAVARAGEPIVTVTACDQVTVDGNTYPRFAFEIQMPNDGAACQFVLDHDFQTAPDDTCSYVTLAAPPGWQTYRLPSYVIWQGCFAGGIEPGQTLGGFQVVVTRPCCGRLWMGNVIKTVGEVQLCLQCPTPTERSSWGVVKSRYR